MEVYLFREEGLFFYVSYTKTQVDISFSISNTWLQDRKEKEEEPGIMSQAWICQHSFFLLSNLTGNGICIMPRNKGKLIHYCTESKSTEQCNFRL